MLSHIFRRRFIAAIGLAIILFLVASDSADAQGRTRVRGYFRKNGTYVAPHYVPPALELDFSEGKNV